MYPSLIKVCYVVPFTLSSKTSCNMKRQRAKRQIKKKKKRKLLMVSTEHSIKNILPSERTKIEISSKHFGFNCKRKWVEKVCGAWGCVLGSEEG